MNFLSGASNKKNVYLMLLDVKLLSETSLMSIFNSRCKIDSLFVFSIDDPKQNAGSHLTPVSSTVFDALSHSTLGFAFHGSFNNHLFH